MIAAVLIPAGGSGTRFGGPKQFATLGGVPLLVHAVRVASDVAAVDKIIVAVPTESLAEARAMLPDEIEVVAGGATRAVSVRNAFNALLQGGELPEIIAIHDAARPLASADLYLRVLLTAFEHGAAVPALPVADTLKRASEDMRIEETVQREGLWAVQTPQAFQAGLLKRAYDEIDDPSVTDEATLIERLGESVVLVPGEPTNRKITEMADLQIAEAMIGAPPRVGHGRDRHPLKADRPLVLAGIPVEDAPAGPVGHSDGDVLCHAIADAILGGAGCGDLGQHFPEQAWTEGMSGDRILEGATKAASEVGFRVASVDATIWIARPHLAEVLKEVAQRIATVLDLPGDTVNLKAKSGNNIDAVGRGEATEAEAVVVLTWR